MVSKWIEQCGLDINNSGVITGSVSSLSAFTANVTASNADGNDSKSISFGVSKGNRVITWEQTFAGLTYGNAPVSLTGTATGSGDFNYTSSDSTILEINGTSMIIRGVAPPPSPPPQRKTPPPLPPYPGGQIDLHRQGPLTITGQDLSLSVGDTIPDLNYTVSGWKYSDASAPFAPDPTSFSNVALWVDAADSSTITESSGAVSQWNDKSGNGKHLTQATAAQKPSTGISTLGGKNILNFGGDDYMTNTSFSVSQPDMIVMVARANGTVDSAFMLDGSSSRQTIHIHATQKWSIYAGSSEPTGWFN